MKNFTILIRWLLGCWFVLLSLETMGQINMSTFPYTQDFNALANTGTGISFTDNTTLTGWYSNRTTYSTGTGSIATGALYSFGAASNTERALGSAASGTTNTIYYGIRLTNNTGNTVTSLQVSYTGEQWRNGGNTTAQKLDFQYQIGATSLTTGTWVDVDNLDFTSPIATASVGALDGNITANKTAITFTITGLNIANGQELWLRWADPNDAGNDHGLAIDDVSISIPAAPQPNLIVNSAIDTPDPVSTSSALKYDLEIKNSGTVNATNVFASVNLPATFGSYTVSPAGTTFDNATGFITVPTLNSGSSAFITINSTAPASAGSISMFISVDPNNSIAESNETDNNSTVSTTVNLASTPDLAIQSIKSVENTVFVNTTLKYEIEIKNIGTATANNVFATVQLPVGFQYTAQNLSAGITFNQSNGFLTITSLAANASVFVTISGNSPLLAGDIALFISVDPQNLITESNENNNRAEVFTTVRGISKISAVQGTTNTSPLATQNVAVEAIVTADFQAANKLGGFFIQEEDADSDGNPNTSEGIFVFTASTPITVNVGDRVKVSGTVVEYTSSGTDILGAGTVSSSSTQITNPTVTIVSNSNPLPTITNITFPLSSGTDWEKYEGMRVAFTTSLVVTDVFSLGRYGQIGLASERLYQFTHANAPNATNYANYIANQRKKIIILDDASSVQNPDPLAYGRNGNPFSASNPLRLGDEIANLTGIVDHKNEGYKIQPTNTVNFTATNPRSVNAPSVGNATLKVMSINVLNYFNQFTACENGFGVGGGTNSNCRGADNTNEFNRQRVKTIAAMITANADVFGIMEMANNGYGANSAIQDLLNGLNAAAGAGTYAFMDFDQIKGVTNVMGTDGIKVAIIYKPATLTPIGTSAILNNVAPFNSNTRPTVAQVFRQNATGATFQLLVNHLKSKGSGTGMNADQNDGQGMSNSDRVTAANAIMNWLATNPTGTGETKTLLIGDMNAYAMEDPITVFKNAGFTDMNHFFHGTKAYSYLFSSQSGYLDHALANNALKNYVTGVEDWHNNADEAIVLDYNTENKSAGQLTSFYNADQFRASDHDPILIGLNFTTTVTLPVVNVNTPNTNVVNNSQNTQTAVITPLNANINGLAINLLAEGSQFIPLTTACLKVNESAWKINLPSNVQLFVYSGKSVAVQNNTIFPIKIGESLLNFVKIENGKMISLNYLRVCVEGARNEISMVSMPNLTCNSDFAGLSALSSSSQIPMISVISGNIVVENNKIKPTGTGKAVIRLTVLGNEFFAGTSTDFTFDIQKANREFFLANPSDKFFGESDFDLPEFYKNEKVLYSSESDLIEIIGNKIKIKGAGSPTIKAKILASDCLHESNQNLFLNIKKAVQSIAFMNIADRKITSANIDLQAFASSNLPITFQILQGHNLVSLQNNSLKINGIGKVKIAAIQSGNQNYLPTYSEQTFEILNDARLVLNKVSADKKGQNLTIEFTRTGFFSENNQFVALLSDHEGNFDRISQQISGNFENGKILMRVPRNVTKSGNYKVMLVSNNPKTESNTLKVPKVLTPVPNTPTANRKRLVICIDNDNAFSYQWYCNGKLLANETNRCITISTLHTGRNEDDILLAYTVVSIDEEGNESDESSPIVVTRKEIEQSNAVTAIESDLEENPIRVYPNPVKDRLVLDLTSKFLRKIEISIFNMLGQKVFEKSFANSEKEEVLDLNHLPAGTYLLEILSEKGKHRQQIVKE